VLVSAALVAVFVLHDGETTTSGFAVIEPENGAVVGESLPEVRGHAQGQVVAAFFPSRGAPIRGKVDVRPDGSFTAIPSRELPPGSYTVRITQRDGGGSSSARDERTFVRWLLGSEGAEAAAGRLGGGARLGEPGPFGRPGAVVAFDGRDDFGVVPDSPALDAEHGATVGTWVRKAGSGGWRVLVAKPGDGRSKLENYGLWLDPSDRAVAFFGDGERYVRTESRAPLDGSWRFVAATYDGATARLYLDGTVVATARSSVPLTPNDEDLNIARAHDDGSHFRGRLAGVVVAPSAFSALRIRALYREAAEAGRVPPKPVITTPEARTKTPDATPAFAGSASTTILDSPTVNVRVWAGPRAAGIPLHLLRARRLPSGAWDVSPPAALEPGVYTARAEQSNDLGAVGRSAPTTFTVETAGSPRGTTILAAGDIADCGSMGDDETAALLDRLPGTVVSLGDHAYDWGTPREFRECYAPTWGRHRARTRPVIGGHEYGKGGGDASTYFRYFRAQLAPFGPTATDPQRGWYSYDLGGWHVVVLNTSWREVGLPKKGSEQVRWLQADLDASDARCTLAVWHDPVFSSGLNGGSVSYRPLWDVLYAHGAEVVLNGHDHDYERFAPQSPGGRYDPRRGIRQFVVGTGGASHYPLPGARVLPNSEVRNDRTFGVLRLTLLPRSYEWEFVPVAGRSFTDGGSGRCR
jgi:hypothetical protein